jgi:hypothetical protein
VIRSDSQPFSCMYFATNAVTVNIMMSFHLLPLGSISRNFLTQAQYFYSFWEKKLYILEHKKTLFSTFCHPCYMPQPPNSSWFDHPNNIWWSVQIMMLLIIQSFPFPITLYLLWQIHYSAPNFKHLQCERATCKSIQTTVHIHEEENSYSHAQCTSRWHVLNSCPFTF